MKRFKGFTLIELLIVVAIIGILAAIAIPNFLQAQVRAKAAKAEAELNALATALETYHIDNDAYVFDRDSRGWPCYITDPLTTPIQYLSGTGQTGLVDLFRQGYWAGPVGERYRYVNSVANRDGWPSSPFPGPFTNWPAAALGSDMDPAFRRYGQWRLSSAGPDHTASYLNDNFLTQLLLYDPTNGTVSDGDIARSQKEGRVTADPNS